MTLRSRTARLATLAVAATALAAGTAVAGHAGQTSAADAGAGLGSGSATATAIPAPAFVGTWNNIASTGHFVKLSFDVVGGQLRIHAFLGDVVAAGRFQRLGRVVHRLRA